jgi:hypothetical protein
LRHQHIDAIDARQIHSGDALQFLGKMEVRIILVLFFLLFGGSSSLTGGATVAAKTRRCFCNSWSHSATRRW